MKFYALWLKVCFSFNVKQGVFYGTLCYCRARDCTGWNFQFGGCLMFSRLLK